VNAGLVAEASLPRLPRPVREVADERPGKRRGGGEQQRDRAAELAQSERGDHCEES
jgi:hypothetical protein